MKKFKVNPILWAMKKAKWVSGSIVITSSYPCPGTKARLVDIWYIDLADEFHFIETYEVKEDFDGAIVESGLDSDITFVYTGAAMVRLISNKLNSRERE